MSHSQFPAVNGVELQILPMDSLVLTATREFTDFLIHQTRVARRSIWYELAQLSFSFHSDRRDFVRARDLMAVWNSCRARRQVAEDAVSLDAR